MEKYPMNVQEQDVQIYRRLKNKTRIKEIQMKAPWKFYLARGGKWDLSICSTKSHSKLQKCIVMNLQNFDKRESMLKDQKLIILTTVLYFCLIWEPKYK